MGMILPGLYRDKILPLRVMNDQITEYVLFSEDL